MKNIAMVSETNLERNLKFLNDKGYTTLRNVINKEKLKSIKKISNDIIGKNFSLNQNEHVVSNVFIGLLEHKDVFCDPVIISLLEKALGENIRISHIEVSRTRPEPKNIILDPNEPYFDKKTGLGFHRDGARVADWDPALNFEPLSMKAAFWLSDLHENNCGNLLVVPETHLMNKKNILRLH